MSNWNDEKVDELIAAINFFAPEEIEGSTKPPKAELVKILSDIPGAYEQWKNKAALESMAEDSDDAEDGDVEEDDSDAEDKVLVKMTRENHSYQIGKYTFTKENPFIVMPKSHANYVLEEDGFVVATPREAEAYYN